MSGIPLYISSRLCSRTLLNPNSRYRQFYATSGKWNIKGSVSELQKEMRANGNSPNSKESFLSNDLLSKNTTRNGQQLLYFSPNSEDVLYAPSSLYSCPEASHDQYNTRSSVTENTNQMKSLDSGQHVTDDTLLFDEHYFYEKHWIPTYSGDDDGDPNLVHKAAKIAALEESVSNVLPINNTENTTTKTKNCIKPTKRKEKAMSKPNKEINIDKNADPYKNEVFMKNLKSYIAVCVNTNLVGRAHSTLIYYRCRSRTQTKYNITDIEVYDAVLGGWAKKGRLEAIKELFSHMRDDGLTPSYNSYGAYLECLSRKGMYDCPEIKQIISGMKNNGIAFEDILQNSIFIGNKKDKLLEIIRKLKESALVGKKTPFKRYTCKLLEKLNLGQKCENIYNHGIDTLLSERELQKMVVTQIQIENARTLKLKSVAAPDNPSEKVLRMRKLVKKCEEDWRNEISEHFKNKLTLLWEKVKYDRRISLYPYLIGTKPESIVDIMLEEIRYLAENCEHFSVNLKTLHRDLGIKVMNQHFLWLKKESKISDKTLIIYHKYMEYIIQQDSEYLPREFWELLKSNESTGPTIDVTDVSWPYPVMIGVGEFLYDILNYIKINANILKTKCVKGFCVPAISTKHINHNEKLSIQIRVAPILCKLYREAKLEDIQFDATMVPTLCPPRPWIRSDAGGYLITRVPFVRLPLHAPQNNYTFSKVPSEQLYPCFDSLNTLSLCPWIINKPILDVIIKLFKDDGCEELNVPVNPTSLPPSPKVGFNATIKEKLEKSAFEKKKRELTSLWYDCLYKLTIANHFRDKVFWFPHNLDFRGRVYPTPPHFNHIGSDLVRGTLLFAEGKPLGKNGLNWLKTHLINLTGLKKRESQLTRLRYADEMLTEILDSADNPLSGNQWWKKSDDPWQTLACCKEIANAIRSPNPEEYISHLPIHQDGSCNGLQHYAALGRDELGAKEVNLHPADVPRDVYSGVAALVELERQKDIENGSEIAEALDGLIKRKVVKQTVMTFVYGVTKYGAKLQILKQLKNLPDFPKEFSKAASTYLMVKTFASIEKMFTATRAIQDWFTECARSITKISGEPVEWVTPLGLPVIQPYHNEISVREPGDLVLQGQGSKANYSSKYATNQPPNILKQKNAFAPNFIHSLDSCHMMLTALYCQRERITFVSVHDCFWTHPSTVEIMNIVCREQFVSLHNEQILEDLSNFFLQKYGNAKRKSKDHKSMEDVIKLQNILKNVPQKGTFELEKVLKSVYFFS